MLYQQGTQRIEIIVRKEGGGTTETAARETPTDEIGGGRATTWRTSVFGSENPNRIKRVIKTNTTHSLAVSKQVIDLGIEYWVAGLGNKNGDQAMQEQVQRQVEVVKDVTNIASSIGMGALYGAWGGPIGAVLGALFGAVSSGVSTAVKYAGREREFNYKMFKENNAIEYQRARASINLTTGRLR
jgi:hypothetical protein